MGIAALYSLLVDTVVPSDSESTSISATCRWALEQFFENRGNPGNILDMQKNVRYLPELHRLLIKRSTPPDLDQTKKFPFSCEILTELFNSLANYIPFSFRDLFDVPFGAFMALLHSALFD